MKKTLYKALLIGLTFGGSLLNAQSSKSKLHVQDATMAPNEAKASFIQNQGYLAPSSVKYFNGINTAYNDSLKGFDENATRATLLNSYLTSSEMVNTMNNRRRQFINAKYNIGPVMAAPARIGGASAASHGGRVIGGGGNSVNNAPCVNEGFETTPIGTYNGASNALAVQGWSLYSYAASGTCGFVNWQLGGTEAWVKSTPITGLPGIGTLPHSPLGGTHVLQMNDNSPNGLQSRVMQTFPVTAANTLFQFAYAGVWDDGGHNCCEQPAVKIGMYDCNGAPLTCSSLSLNAIGPSCASGGQNATFTTTGTSSWTNWQVKYIDLTPFVGTCVTLELINGDCIFGGHYGMVFIDTQCGGQVIGVGLGGVGGNIAGPVSYCAGSNQAIIAAPLGYANYQWVSPITGTIPAYMGGTAPTLTVFAPVPNSVYTVNLVTGSGCFFTSTQTITTSNIQIVAIGANSTCIGGSSGTATVVCNGSGTGYTYSWQNSTGSVVGTSSLITGLPAGIYSITAGGLGVSGCGVSTTTVQVGVTATPTTSLLKPYCGSTAYLAAPYAGTNFQWYNGLATIAAGLGGNSPSLTVTSPCNGCVYWLTYHSIQGCNDSIKFTLYPSAAGALTIPDPGVVCPGGTNGAPTIVIAPAPGSPSGLNGYTVTNTSAPNYTAAVSGVFSNTFTPTGMASGGYNVNAFDGSCYYTTSFNLPTLTFNYSISPPSTTLCSGSFTTVSLTFPSTPGAGQYLYAWSPGTALSGTAQSVVIASPTVPVGVTSTLIYTAVVTSTMAMCPVSHTFALTTINPQIPVISAISNLCDNGSPVTIAVTPGGGTFSTSAVSTNGPTNPIIGATSGIITPSNAPTTAPQNIIPVTYSYGIPTGIGNTQCKANTSTTFQVNHYNTPVLTSSVQPICINNGTVDLMAIVQNTVTGVWSGPGGSVSGGVFSPASLSNSPIFTSPSYSAIVTLTYNTQSSPNPTVCPAFSLLQVAVTKTVVPQVYPPSSICNTVALVTLTANPSGGGWTGNGIPNNGVVTPSLLASGVINITYTVANGTCVNTNTTSLTVSQFNSAGLSSPLPELCFNNAPFNLQAVSVYGGGTWGGLNVSAGLLSPGTLTTGIYALTHTALSTPIAGVCNDIQTFTISVKHPLPSVITQPNILCSITAPFQMVATPATGSWVATSYLSASGIFNPLLALIGNNTVQYVVGTSTCNAPTSINVNVEGFVSAVTTTASLPNQCSSNAMFNLTPYSSSGLGSWSGPGVSGISFNPSAVGAGSFILTHNTASSPSGLCPDQATVAVSVYSLQAPIINNVAPLCSSHTLITLQPVPTGGTFSGINTNAVSQSGLFNPALGIEGGNIVSYTATNGPCVAYAQATITIEKMVTADLLSYPKSSYCKNDVNPLNLNQFVQNQGGDWSGPGVTGNMLNFANANVGDNNRMLYQIKSKPNGLCTDTSWMRIKVIDVPPVSITADPAVPGCAPYTVKLNMPNTNSVDGLILWDLGDGTKNTSSLSLTHTYDTPGTYSIVFTLSGGCKAQAILANPIIVVDKPKANFIVPEEVNTSNTEIQVNNLTSGSNVYQWQVASSATVITGPSPSFMLPAIPGRYPVTLTVKNIGGCTDEMTKTIEVRNEFNIFIPTSFTPNFDKLNDEFMPKFTPYGLDTYSYEMEIFDRWGTSLFRTKDPNKGWDGSVQNKGLEILKEDSYVYRLKYKDLDGNVYNKIGHLTLIK